MNHAALSSLDYASFIKVLQSLNLVAYVNVAASTLFAYDYALTLHLEIDLIWTSEWNAVRVLYLIQRYTPFVDTLSLLLYRLFALHLTGKNCEGLTYAYAALNTLGIMTSEALLAICIWALWVQSKRIALFLCVAFILVWTPACAFMYIFVNKTRFIDSSFIVDSLYADFRGCFNLSSYNGMIWTWVALAFWDALALGLVVLPAVESYHTGLYTVSALSTVVYRNGILYYLSLFGMSIINIVANVVLPPDLRIITTALTRCIHSMLASRVLLHIRAHAKSSGDVANIATVKDDLVFVREGGEYSSRVYA